MTLTPHTFVGRLDRYCEVPGCKIHVWPAKIADQPPPIANEGTPVWDLVIADMKERDHVGRERYGTPLQTNNGRDALVDAYQEALDLVVYLRQAIAERAERVRAFDARTDRFIGDEDDGA